MRNSLRSDGGAGRLVVLAVALCLIAPPLAHNHDGERTPVSAIAGQPCSSGGDSGHLHPASLKSAPACPACAAGPSASSTLAAGVEIGPTTPGVPLAGLTTRPGPGARRAPARSRAPPCLLAA